MPAEAELILFGIQAAVRINQQFRHAFADSTRSQAITLPLPNFPDAVDRSSIENFYRFGDGQGVAGSNLRVQELLSKLSKTGDLSSEEDLEFAQLFREHNAMVLAGGPGLVGTGENPSGITDQDLSCLVSIRQWREGQDPNPTMLRRMAGTLVNIAVDYAVEMPGVISTNTARGRTLLGLLQGFENIDFATDGRAQIMEGLFTAALETMRDHPDLLADNERTRALFQTVAKGLFEGSRELLAAPGQTLTEKERVAAWAQMVFTSVVKTVGTAVFAQPEQFPGLVGASQAELVSKVGGALLTSVLAGNGLNLHALFTREGLDRVVKAALTVVGNHPELLADDNRFLTNLIGTTATELAKATTPLANAFLPEAIRLILEHTAEHLELLMPAGKNRPEEHLLVAAGREVLAQLAAEPPTGAAWQVRFGPAEALQVLKAVAGEVVSNPGLLGKEADAANSLLGEMAQAVMATLRASAPPQLSGQTGLIILEAALRAAGQRLEFLEKDQQQRLFIAVALKTVLTNLFHADMGPRAAWVLARDAVVGKVVTLILEALVQHGVTEAKLAEARKALDEAALTLADRGSWSLESFALQLAQRLA